jgi:tight adherence protein B
MELLILFMTFCTVLLLTASLYYVYHERHLAADTRVRERLQSAMHDQSGQIDQALFPLLKSQLKSEIPSLHQLLSRFQIFERLQKFLLQADSTWTAGRFLLTSLLVATVAWLVMHGVFHRGFWVSAIGAAGTGVLPAIFFSRRKRLREQAFNEQLPDLLDLMTRALRAGHAVSAAINFAGEESPAPAGPEFRRVFEEINFGMDIPVALENLATRVDCYDLRYLVAAITIQRETGGNLSELFDRLAYIIRERYKLVGQTRALTAQGRLSGHILTVLPVVMAGVLYFTQPGYLRLLVDDPMGRTILVGALVMQVFGYLVIRWIVNIETL